MQPMNMAVVFADALAAGTVVAALFYILRGFGRLPWPARIFGSVLLVGSAFASLAMVLVALGHGDAPRVVAQGPWPSVERAVAVARDYGLVGVDVPAQDTGAPLTTAARSAETQPEPVQHAASTVPSTPTASPPTVTPQAATPHAVTPSAAASAAGGEPARTDTQVAALPDADRSSPPVVPAPVRDKPATPAVATGDTRAVVFFATDREPSPSAPPQFGSMPAERVSLGTVRLAGGAGRAKAAPERSWISRVVGGGAGPGDAVAEAAPAAELAVLDPEAWANAAGAAARDARRTPGQALVFVHGYNRSLEQAAALAADVARDLEFDGLIAAYSWASEGRVASYSHDRDAATASAAAMRGFLEGELARTGVTKVHVVAHGIGAAALLAALAEAPLSPAVSIGQVFLVAPDVEPGRLKRFAQVMKGKTAGITLYAAKQDRGLTVARRFHGGAARAGDLMGGEPLLIDGIESVDVSTAAAGALGDAGHLNPAVAADMAAVMHAGSRGSVQGGRLHKVAASRGGAYWRWSAQ